MNRTFLTISTKQPIFAACLALAVGASGLHAQATYVPPTAPAAAAGAPVSANTIANMNDDIQTLRRLVGQLQLDVKTLQDENDGLRKQIASQVDINAAVQNAVAKYRDEMNKAITQTVTQTVTQANTALRKDIVDTVTRQIEALARDTNDQMQKLAAAIGRPPPVSNHVTAAPPSQTLPPSDIDSVQVYVVKPGETASKIAANNHVSLADMAKVNPSVDLNKIRQGQQIAIPLKKGAMPPASTN